MASEILVIAILVSIVTFLVLYVFIRAETTSTTVTDRADAEREAREFGGRDGPKHRD